METSVEILKKAQNYHVTQPTVLGHIPKQHFTLVQKHLFILIAALFIIAWNWKQPRCPSADEWIMKVWYIYTVEYYSTLKKLNYETQR